MYEHTQTMPNAKFVDLEMKYYDKLHSEKYRDINQTKMEHCSTMANNLASTGEHYNKLLEIFSYHRFLPAGRVQAALGATEREVSPFNCAVSQKIEDNMDSIMAANSNAAKILRLGTGIGFNFSHLRPHGDLIKKLMTRTCGPVAFMRIFDVTASTIASSGHRRGALMGIMNIDHPDIELFIDAKMEKDAYRQFNLSVGVTDKFMEAVKSDGQWPLIFNGKVYRTISARTLWNKIIKNAYDSAEPGIIFIDRLNQNNNLWYCEHIEATNPCAEQPLPPHGLCTLGSFNLPAYLYKKDNKLEFNYIAFTNDIRDIVEAYDNIFDNALYAIPEHEAEARSKRRIGLGFTGIANAIELLCNKPCYGESDFCEWLNTLSQSLCYHAYQASINLAKKRGPFAAFNEKYLESKFIKTLPMDLQQQIAEHGIRNSHLISYAPCGTISQTAYNVSSGVEPVFYHVMKRDVYMQDGMKSVEIKDFAYREFGFKGKTLEECSVQDHINVVEVLQKYTDSAITKTVNVAKNCTYEDYENIYKTAYEVGLKGMTVYRPNELRGIVIQKAEENELEDTEENNNNIIELGDASPVMNCANGLCSL